MLWLTFAYVHIAWEYEVFTNTLNIVLGRGEM